MGFTENFDGSSGLIAAGGYKDEHAAAFYRHYGFVALSSHPLTLFLMREDVEKTVAATQA